MNRRLCLALAVLGTAVVGGGVAALPAAAGTSTQTTYTATVTIPVPPASNYSGSAGGDGWAIALSPAAVFNVFHHQATMQVACHLQSDASACWTPRTVTDASGHDFATSGHPGLWFDQANQHLYVYGTRSFDSTAGVVCIDTVAAATSANPFCGFVALSAVGDAPPASGISGVSDGIVVGSKFWALNFVSGAAATGTKNALMCFDTTTLAACAAQPYSTGLGAGTVSVGAFPPPSIAPILDQIIVPVDVASTSKLACFDTSSLAPCAGSWPVALPATYGISTNGAPYPLVSAAGTITGLCLPDGTDECYSLTGSTVATPAGMAAAIDATSGWNGPAFVLGTRVYVPNGNSNSVDCYDAGTSASCTNFPKALSGLELLYTVNPDPQRPECLWVNADGGASQIQNFDAFTGGACGAGGIRVLAASVVAPTVLCEPASWTALKVLTPARADYRSGSVHFEDGDADPIPGIPDAALDGDGAIDLSPLALTTAHGLPQFLITLTDEVGPRPGSIKVELSWVGTADPSCVKPGTTTSAPPSSTPPVASSTPPVASSTPPTPTTSSSPGTAEPLAATGENTVAMAVLALVLLTLGAGMLVITGRTGRGRNRPRHG